jgi:hypothetical protein
MSRRLPPAYEKSVFINCPFDPEFRDLMLAIVLTVVAHGFVPRGAREAEGIAQPRLRRILETISESKYSIHDLSRFTGEGVANLARFNMPLELGMSAAFQFERDGSSRPHKWLALVPEGFAYQQFISDLAGFDPGRHDRSVASVIREVSAWLRIQARSSTQRRRLCKSIKASPLFDNRSLRFERKLSRRKPGQIYFSPLTGPCLSRDTTLETRPIQPASALTPAPPATPASPSPRAHP